MFVQTLGYSEGKARSNDWPVAAHQGCKPHCVSVDELQEHPLTLGRNQRYACAFALEHCIGRNGRSVDHLGDRIARRLAPQYEKEWPAPDSPRENKAYEPHSTAPGL
jgi:hypothetical protein